MTLPALASHFLLLAPAEDAASAGETPPADTETTPPEEKPPVVTQHRLNLADGRSLSYAITTGLMRQPSVSRLRLERAG
jgi:hypothetical protein